MTKAEWIADVRDTYGDNAAEELDCIPKQGSGSFLDPAKLAACEHPDAGRPELYAGGLFYVGRDVARRRDLPVIHGFEEVGDVLWMRERWLERGATGATVSGDDHLRLSLRTILSTLIGSCVMDRDFGSRVPALLDAPIGPAVIADLVAATAEAIHRWEPRVVLKRVLVASASVGRLSIDLLVEIKGRVVRLEGIV